MTCASKEVGDTMCTLQQTGITKGNPIVERCEGVSQNFLHINIITEILITYKIHINIILEGRFWEILKYYKLKLKTHF